jgi:hypothetical protein
MKNKKRMSEFFSVKKNRKKILFIATILATSFILSVALVVLIFSSEAILAMDSNSYTVNTDSINFMGDEGSSSTSYKIYDTGGEIATGDSSSDSYEMRAGYRAMTEDYQVSISCTDNVDMGQITGTGQSTLTTNEASCNVITDNPAGYSLVFNSDTTYLENAHSDQIAAYTPVVFGTPEYWDVDPAASEWGARLKKSGSTTYNSSRWGAASASENYANADVYWHSVSNASSFTVVSRSNETSLSGDSEIIQFGAEVGSSKFQPSGTYDVDVTITAISL